MRYNLTIKENPKGNNANGNKKISKIKYKKYANVLVLPSLLFNH